jgi:peptidoglycan-associated lipoprotein
MLKRLSTLVLAIALGATSASCATRSPVLASPAAAVPVLSDPVAPFPQSSEPERATVPTAVPTEEEVFARSSVADLNEQRLLREVLFDVDSSGIREDAQSVLQKNAEWLHRWFSVAFRVEGHCDERGTSEYNLALGERRASAMKTYLVGLGVTADRITTVSKGKEAPLCREAAESCWQQNRRGQFIITAK